MPNAEVPLDLNDLTANDGNLRPAEQLHLRVTFDLVAGVIRFDWLADGGRTVAATGCLSPSVSPVF